MLTLEQIRAALEDRHAGKVARATGLHVNTIFDIKNNPDANPTYRVMQALNKYLERSA